MGMPWWYSIPLTWRSDSTWICWPCPHPHVLICLGTTHPDQCIYSGDQSIYPDDHAHSSVLVWANAGIRDDNLTPLDWDFGPWSEFFNLNIPIDFNNIFYQQSSYSFEVASLSRRHCFPSSLFLPSFILNLPSFLIFNGSRRNW